MIVIIVTGIVIIIAATLLVKYIVARRASRRSEAWEGVVLSKDRSSPDGQNMYHYVTVRLANNTIKKVSIPGSLWKTLNEGDKIQKRSGDYDPRAI